MSWLPKENVVGCPNPECSNGGPPHMRYYNQGGYDMAVWCPYCGIIGPKIRPIKGDLHNAKQELEAIRLWNIAFRKTKDTE